MSNISKPKLKTMIIGEMLSLQRQLVHQQIINKAGHDQVIALEDELEDFEAQVRRLKEEAITHRKETDATLKNIDMAKGFNQDWEAKADMLTRQNERMIKKLVGIRNIVKTTVYPKTLKKKILAALDNKS